MKKTYTKPEIIFEDFTTSTNIAAGCEGIVGSPAKDTCTVVGSGNIVMFDNGMSLCDYTPPEGDKWDSFCYHVPTEYNNLFNS